MYGTSSFILRLETCDDDSTDLLELAADDDGDWGLFLRHSCGVLSF